jgi:hypothetical protein
MSTVLSAATRRTVVLEIAELAHDKYVFPVAGEQLAEMLRTRLERGDYDEISDSHELAATLTEELQATSGDRHWSVVYDPGRRAANVDPETEEDAAAMARWSVKARRRNFGFERVERLRGNIGYIDLREFVPSEYAGETAVAAMALVAHCAALVFDLRRNHGGYPSMVQLLTSYLLDAAPRHINTFFYRPTGEYQQFWTFPHVLGQRLPDVPVYVLISRATGSGAEEFAYNLKHMDRAILVGETTVGAAHPITLETVQESYYVRLPYGRPINPITDSNWEGTGVEPHIPVDQRQALQTAHLHALDRLADGCHDERRVRDLRWEAEIVKSLHEPVAVGEDTLARYAGDYGQRSFGLEEGALIYCHRAYDVSWSLTPMTETRFRLDDDVKFEFTVDEEGAVPAVLISYRDGRPDIRCARTA